ncbi:MAG TPA: response regulator transcription factor [Streptosporangiaceae bacterium]
MAQDSPGPEARLLVVEDDPGIADLLSDALSFAGFEVRTAATAADALREVAARPPDLIVLDIMLPDSDGFDVLKRIRGQSSSLPVVFLSARDGVADRVAGLDLGAADYVVKPFSMDEVLARIRAVLRRGGPGGAQDSGRRQVAGLELDADTGEVRRDGQPVALTPNEFKLLRCLMTNAGRVLTRAQIADYIWDYDFTGEINLVESYISALRRKVDTSEPRLIHTVRGFGYVLRVPP